MKLQTIGTLVWAAKNRLAEVDLTDLDNDEVTYKFNTVTEALAELLEVVDELTNKGDLK
jgi:hypothetical protein